MNVDETLRRLSAHKNVIGVVIVNSGGNCIATTLEPLLAKQYASLITSLVDTARTTVRTIDDQNDLTFLRVRTKQHEIMVGPSEHLDYLLITIRNLTEG
ncbi:hypothetical protein BC936DRAFT_138598 [Jimgerdemannia flammicorona]|uniref:Dynein light chain roadblock n=1 Tax=Jimgerdemannia flammicorona TaxID=994334 RepID=A0A433C0A6_9FUNG|nr:hypothetical protein BC936DRAFT_138598 [Jimgerdemannia flammicorona]